MGCRTLRTVSIGQPFPRSNRSTIKVDQALPHWLDDDDARVFSYKLTTLTKSAGTFVQDGNAPNYQGQRITLCTCMHWHRASIRSGMWVAGFGGKKCGDDNELFYLMKVAKVFDDFAKLWKSKDLPDRSAKSASRYIYGDMYVPRAGGKGNPHNPNSYKKPPVGHKHRRSVNDRTWCKDIDLWRPDPTKRRVRPPPKARIHKLLLGEPGQSFLWRIPMYRYKGGHPRQQRPTLAVFLKQLEEI